MPRLTPRARLIVLVAGTLTAVALFATSLVGLAGLDGRLETAVNAERSRDAVPVRLEKHERDCPEDDERPPADQLRF